ncbi:PREDICTED: uncharacterized protein LOC109169281 [Ipomoea nil]|uniref:uncharacterized protein LOC109169281 n=1 Tax=Ipomoea nil TaxID=35883 RepID=UPI000900DEFA|nr:PREDICTED: uncharacterized protein LOC109169281 [Ipomoea nil]XP_019173700.1 PREDICTED: uncharacterized protein LOC109169281 [Ipomoea nil]
MTTAPTMMFPLKQIQKLLQRLWGNWNIHAIVVASLGFQCVLEFVAPLRKRRKKGSTHLTIWSAYLLADYFATFGIALINSNSDDQDAAGNKSSLLEAFWAPFLLLHLGGPHAITSFNIEDNNLWHRQLLTLIVQTFSVLLVFYRYQIYRHRCLTISAGIVFFVGIVKYAERTHSLYLASVSHMRRSMLENNSSSSKGSEELSLPANPDKLEIIHRGYIYYQLFKGFILDHAFIHIEDKLEAVRKVFLTLDHETAYKILEVELNFMYESMFTKMAAVQWISSFGYAYRFVVHVLLLAVTITFYFCNKSGASSLHISITYLLLGGAVVLDLVALWKLVCSEWTVALMMEKPREERNNLRNWISRHMRDPRIMKRINTIHTWISSRKRWSKEIRQYSLINHSSFKKRWQPLDRIINSSGLIRERLDAWQYTTIQPVECLLLHRVFHAIKNKAEATETKGGGDEQRRPEVHHEYDNSVLIWHVATEICYFSGGQETTKMKDNKKLCRNISEYLVYFLVMEGKLTSTVPGNIGLRFKDICWEEVKDTINEIVAGLSKTTFRRHRLVDHINSITSAKLNDFKDAAINLANRNNRNNNNNNATADQCNRKRTRWEKLKMKWEDKKRREVCEHLLLLQKFTEDSENPRENPSAKSSSDDDYAKSILSKAIKLAKHLKSCCRQDPDPEGPNNINQNEQDVEYPGSTEELIGQPNRPDNNNVDEEDCCSEEELWEILSHVWIGFLLYGASHCREDVQYLNKGGELLTFVRLLMVHFGLRETFRDEAGAAGGGGGFKLAAELQKVIKDEKLLPFLPKITSNFLP